jgi:serine/threonine-protein kinase
MEDVIAELEPLVRHSGPPASVRESPEHARTGGDELPDSGDTRTTRRGLAASAAPPSAAPSAPWYRKRRWVALGIAAVALVGVAALYKKGGPRTPANPVIAGPGGKHGVASASPVAVREYDEGLQAMWDGSAEASNRHFEAALAADPTLAAAHLRLCLGTFDGDPTAARSHYRSAYEHRAALDAKDMALLDATEAYVREPSDVALWEKRLDAASARFPSDPEIVYRLGWARQLRNNFEGAAEAYKNATRLDPHFALAWWSRGEVKYLDGNVPEALASYDDCLKMAPQATICIHERARVYRREGDCPKMEAEAKASIAKEPDAPLAHYYLAEALYARGRPMETVKEALDQYFAKLPASERPERELFYRASLANLSGDFVAAEGFAREKQKLIEGRTDRADHFNVAALLADIYVESGRMDEAAKVAEAYLARQDLWIGFTNPLYFHHVLYRAKKIDLEAFEQRRAEWLAQQQEDIKTRGEGKAGQLRERAFPWIDGYAELAQTKDEANAALALLPAYLPLPPPTRRNVGREMDLGKVRALVGDDDGALFHLQRAAAHCGALDYPSPHTRAHYYLGVAEEGLGDKVKACAAYGVVLARWGDAKPASVTAQKAKTRATALGCK